MTEPLIVEKDVVDWLSDGVVATNIKGTAPITVTNEEDIVIDPRLYLLQTRLTDNHDGTTQLLLFIEPTPTAVIRVNDVLEISVPLTNACTTEGQIVTFKLTSLVDVNVTAPEPEPEPECVPISLAV